MKSKNIGQVLRSAAKRSTLLVIALLSFQTIESKNDKQSKKPVVRRHVVAKIVPADNQSAVEQVTEQDSYKKTIKIDDLQQGDDIEAFVDVQSKQLEDGTIVETKTTIEPDVEHGTVKTTVEEWTMYDYAKAAAIGAGVLGAVGLGLAYQDQIAERLNSGASQLNDWWAGEQKSVVNKNSVEVILDKKTTDSTTQDIEVLKNAMLERKDYKVLDMLEQKFNSMTPEEKDIWVNKNAQLVAMGGTVGGFVGGVQGGAKGAQVGAVAGTGLGALRGAQMLRAGGSPKAIAGKVAMSTLQGALVGAGGGLVGGATVGTGFGATTGVALALGSDLINTMDVPADYKATDVKIDESKQNGANIEARATSQEISDESLLTNPR